MRELNKFRLSGEGLLTVCKLLNIDCPIADLLKGKIAERDEAKQKLREAVKALFGKDVEIRDTEHGEFAPDGRANVYGKVEYLGVPGVESVQFSNFANIDGFCLDSDDKPDDMPRIYLRHGLRSDQLGEFTAFCQRVWSGYRDVRDLLIKMEAAAAYIKDVIVDPAGLFPFLPRKITLQYKQDGRHDGWDEPTLEIIQPKSADAKTVKLVHHCSDTEFNSTTRTHDIKHGTKTFQFEKCSVPDGVLSFLYQHDCGSSVSNRTSVKEVLK